MSPNDRRDNLKIEDRIRELERKVFEIRHQLISETGSDKTEGTINKRVREHFEHVKNFESEFRNSIRDLEKKIQIHEQLINGIKTVRNVAGSIMLAIIVGLSSYIVKKIFNL